MKRIDRDSVFFIGDECHRHAAEAINRQLPSARFKMGLSATPYDDSDDAAFDGSDYSSKQRITQYYGSIVADYSLHQALLDEVLTPYNYYLTIVHLTERETELYGDYTREIGRLMSIDRSRENTALNNAIRKRNKIVSNAEGKLNALDNILKNDSITDRMYSLFYVGEGKAGIEDDEDLRWDFSDDASQLDEVSQIIRRNGWKVSPFTAKEKKSDRKITMRSFTDGSIDGLVSMRVLDEGIDIPKCQRAFILASSRNARQFIQRRGRILRKFPGKKLAHIYDFLVAPSPNSRDQASVSLVEKELRRAMDFVILSNNRVDCENTATDIAQQFGLDIMEIRYE